MINSLDHIVITTRALDKCIAFYTGVLGMQLERFGEGRIALRFGEQKFNVHPPATMPASRHAIRRRVRSICAFLRTARSSR